MILAGICRIVLPRPGWVDKGALNEKKKMRQEGDSNEKKLFNWISVHETHVDWVSSKHKAQPITGDPEAGCRGAKEGCYGKLYVRKLGWLYTRSMRYKRTRMNGRRD